MAATIKTIIAAIKQQIRGIPAYSAKTVKSYPPDVEQWLDSEYNAPFVGVSLSSMNHDEHNHNNSIAEENFSFTLMIIEENQNLALAMNSMAGRIDSIRGVLQGDSMGISGLDPVKIGEVTPAEDVPEHGLVVYMMNISTWQVRGNT